jgi:2',3'-cyclic-nucleotide 2'-phosphodiesterase (5'-nucleotidase family)
LSNGNTETLASLIKPYILIPFLGRKIAVFGIEGTDTPKTTLAANVASIKFGAIEDLSPVINTLWSTEQADVFVAIIHAGDGKSDKDFNRNLTNLPLRVDGSPLFDAVIAGHTHMNNEEITESGIPYIQSGANGEKFGVIQLVLKQEAVNSRLVVERDRTRLQSSVGIDAPESYWEEIFNTDESIDSIIRAGLQTVDTIANQKIGHFDGPLSRTDGRLSATVMGNFLTDAMRLETGVDVALINNGDVRADIAMGDLLFDGLFRVLPKNLKVVVIKDLSVDLLARNFMRAIRSCGIRGVLETSGVTAIFKRKCINGAKEDPDARLMRLINNDGTVLWENVANVTQIASPASCPVQEIPCPRCVKIPTVNIATTDFIALDGGAGYCHFIGLPNEITGDLKETIATFVSQNGNVDPEKFKTERYINCADSQSESNPLCAIP